LTIKKEVVGYLNTLLKNKKFSQILIKVLSGRDLN